MNHSTSTRALKDLIEDYVSAYPQKTGEKAIWRQPLLATAVADERFDILPQIAAGANILPIILKSWASNLL